MKTRSEISCEKVQELLLDQSMENLDEEITGHLETCGNCRKFQRTLTAISRSARISREDDLSPDPRIIAMLKRNLRKKSTTNSPFDSLLAFFQKKIPVYQIMVAVFIAAMLYFSVAKMSRFQANTNRADLASRPESEVIQSTEFPATQLDQDKQLGKSLSEDSLLAKFRVSIL